MPVRFRPKLAEVEQPGADGRGIERELPAETVAELEASAGSLEQTLTLFRRVAHEVANALGYTYPQRADDVVSAYVDALSPAPPASRQTNGR
jgi:streptomycin adenylyltransferase